MNEKKLENALFKVLEGIREELFLSVDDYCKVLHVDIDVYSFWVHEKRLVKGKISIDKFDDLLEFIDIYDCITSLFVKEEDAIKWYIIPLDIYNSKTPLEFLKEKESNVQIINSYVNRLLNP